MSYNKLSKIEIDLSLLTLGYLNEWQKTGSEFSKNNNNYVKIIHSKGGRRESEKHVILPHLISHA